MPLTTRTKDFLARLAAALNASFDTTAYAAKLNGKDRPLSISAILIGRILEFCNFIDGSTGTIEGITAAGACDGSITWFRGIAIPCAWRKHAPGDIPR